jgi:hypothetical protein
MRDLTPGHYIAMAIPAVATAFGIHYLVARHHPSAPVDGKDTSAAATKSEQGSRKIASVADRGGDRGSASGISLMPGEDDRKVADTADTAKAAESEAEGGRKPSGASTGGECAALEYPGSGPQATRVTKRDWAVVMRRFHEAKRELLAWIDKRRAEMPEATSDAMAHQVRGLKIQRPPASEEPDLSWRGIGVYTQSSEGEPIVKVGGGFIRLAIQHPERGRFEMTRLVAQSIAPCELKRIGAVEGSWAPLLGCLGVSESQACAQGSYSEGGWAVSTTLAAAVSPPGCKIPAFDSPDMAKCLNTIPLAKDNPSEKDAGRSVASNGPRSTTVTASTEAQHETS